MFCTSIACIACLGKKVLIAHRQQTGVMGGKWEFPGGKVEAGETDQQAIIREFREEFGVDVTVGEHIADAEFEHAGNMSKLHAFRIYVPHDGISSPYGLSEHTEYKWVDPDVIRNLDFVDSDMKLFPEIRKYLKKISSEK
jgi:8-oxo-dGTP diphosphatase